MILSKAPSFASSVEPSGHIRTTVRCDLCEAQSPIFSSKLANGTLSPDPWAAAVASGYRVTVDGRVACGPSCADRARLHVEDDKHGADASRNPNHPLIRHPKEPARPPRPFVARCARCAIAADGAHCATEAEAARIYTALGWRLSGGQWFCGLGCAQKYEAAHADQRPIAPVVHLNDASWQRHRLQVNHQRWAKNPLAADADPPKGGNDA